MTILRWLSRQLPRSVVYVAIGSEATLSAGQERELASWMELSRCRFFGQRRRRRLAPPARDGDQRLGPQLEILRHNSVGAFVTHCGYNSVIEGLQFGSTPAGDATVDHRHRTDRSVVHGNEGGRGGGEERGRWVVHRRRRGGGYKEGDGGREATGVGSFEVVRCSVDFEDFSLVLKTELKNDD
ncbi:hypothetical protein ZIOFF_048435 [Zingiber officinale]|uniref:Uncharacterized protein n=1 Tax=Zingiber officinale TaxID=94328 RepID=A0A8J5FTA6_ZINOF|nr:hypothetical protein ZIOFF_048435 [Zingiber officinale]